MFDASHKPGTKDRVLLSWSSGKDSAWALHTLRAAGVVDVAGLLTTFNAAFDRVAMHAVRSELVERQAEAAGLPLLAVPLPWPCDNATYESVLSDTLAAAKRDLDLTHVAFGDLFLEEVRAYRERHLRGTGLGPLFPLWGLPTRDLASMMIDSGLRAVLTCVDPRRLAATFAGRTYDESLLRDLPPDVDPCGENGEFHTFVTAGPMFSSPILHQVGGVVERDGFVFADVLPAE